MKISEIITDKYKLRIPPTVYYDLLADVLDVEEKQEPKTGHWTEEFNDLEGEVRFTCSSCGKYQLFGTDFCYHCGAKMVETQEGEGEE